MMRREPATFIDILRLRAEQQPSQTAYTFLTGEGTEAISQTYGALDAQARAVGVLLQSQVKAGETVLLLYPAGLEYVAAFFGCLYAGAIAVPSYPPRLNRSLDRLQAIIANSGATVALTTSSTLSRMQPLLAHATALKNVRWLTTDDLSPSVGDSWQEPPVNGGTPAFLQYTSGSTSAPKGVMVSHGNLLHNERTIQEAFRQTERSVIVGWLPLYHDMGLIGNVLQPLYLGARCVLFSPHGFLQRPVRWLQAISQYKATTSGGPNFAYDLCARQTTPEQRETLDLSSWSVAFNGAEPLRAETLELFARTFEPCGFRREAFYPCYGLAEATLLVSAKPPDALPTVSHFAAQALAEGRAVETRTGGEGVRRLVGCGRASSDTRVVVVDLETEAPRRGGEVGEVWVAGPSIAAGYWKQTAQTAHTFYAHLSTTGEGPFLRTGDLGFLEDGELYLVGRLKDLIIIRGRNYYPEDIEYTVERCHERLRPHGGAAFAVEAGGEERLVVVQEAGQRKILDAGEILDSIRQEIAEEYEIRPYAVALIKSGTIPRTSSGKIQRHACREAFLAGTLPVVAQWREATNVEHDAPVGTPGPDRKSVEEIQEWLRSQLATRLRMNAGEIDIDKPLTKYGFDSLTAVEMTHSVEEELGVVLDAAEFLRGSTIAELAARAVSLHASADGEQPSSDRTAGRTETEYPLSYGQQALWYLYQLAPESAAYNLTAALRLRGELDVDALRRAFRKLVERHAALRTTFTTRDGKPLQRVHERTDVYVEVADAAAWSEEALNARLAEAAHRPFNLEEDALMRVNLFARSADDHVLLWAMHHIVADFWSMAVLARELGTLYDAEKSGTPPAPMPLPAQYADYVRRQAQMLAGGEGERLSLYWRGQLAGELPMLNLPFARPRPPAQTYRGASESFKLDAGLTEKLKALGRSHEATLYMTLLAAFQSLLHRYSGQEEVIVGSPAAGRNRVDFSGAVGYFVNPLALRINFSGNPSFASLLAQVRRTVLDALAHQDYPFGLVVEELQTTHDPSRSPIFQVMFTLQKTHWEGGEQLSAFALGEKSAAIRLGGLQLESLSLEQRAAQFDLLLAVTEADGEIAASMQYNTDLFDAAAVRRMAEHFTVLLEGAVADPHRPVAALPLLPPQERHQLLVEWNDTKADYPQQKCIHHLIEAQVERTPHAVALVFEGEQYTYRELNRRANQLAHHLRRAGVGPEVPVGILLEKSAEMVFALLGILKAGGAYVPLDPSYPRERLDFMHDDAAVPVLLTRRELLPNISARSPQVVCLDTDAHLVAQESAENPGGGATADNLAYVIYTSGSTGRPKGVMIQHRNVINFFAGMDERIGDDAPGCWLSVTSISFDISVLEIFWTLARGFKVVIQREQEIASGYAGPLVAASDREIDFSLCYFASDNGRRGEDKYQLLIDGAKFADRHGFAAVWTPERHFHAFGGLYPNPSVTSAALATITEHVQLRAGSVVLPLHHPVRVAEEWAVVDNLSRGRVGLSFASGWHADDFVFAPDKYAERKAVMLREVETVRKLWRGEAVRLRGGAGNDVEVKISPLPIQAELPVWLTAAGSPETFRAAGEIGANLLTHLLGQSVEELAGKIKVYREAWAKQGDGTGHGHVTLMLHTFIGEDLNEVREKVREPFCNYLMSSIGLARNLVQSLGLNLAPGDFTRESLEDLLSSTFDRYFEQSGLFGTSETCQRMIARLKAIGVDEVACLIDFGVDTASVLSGLRRVHQLKEQSSGKGEAGRRDYSLAAQIRRHRVTHLQCTPSLARMLTADAKAFDALRSLRKLMLGGEALPASLAEQLRESVSAEIHNMYGPTETTIWSTTKKLGSGDRSVTIGCPIANTTLYILDAQLQPVPRGLPGELYIGGLGVVRGYLKRPELTVERFIPDPFGREAGARLYRTGDLARYTPDGEVEFLGRLDGQVKIRGHRLELGEIETVIGRHPGVREAVVVAREDQPGNAYLAAYLVAEHAGSTEARERLAPLADELRKLGRDTHNLPGGLRVAHHGALQTGIIYREIFQDKIYLRHGIRLNDGACVFDVGANIGLFTLYAHQHCRRPSVYSFEPIPPNFELLKTNAALYGLDAKLFECGLSNRAGSAVFNFYPEAAGLSGRVAGVEEEKKTTQSVIRSWLKRVAPGNGKALLPQDELEQFLEEKFRSESYTCPLKTLSEVIREQNVGRIDLLKVDVEGSEYEVLSGLEAEDWSRVGQLVVEVGSKELLGKITPLLDAHGFSFIADEFIQVEEDADGGDAFVYMLYGVNPALGFRLQGAVEDGRTETAQVDGGAPGLSVKDLRERLREQLPEYMIPSAFVVLDALPLTPNGKVDRRALPPPRAAPPAESESPVEESQTPTEKELVGIWREVLGIERASVNDDFFDSGGHSLTATQLVSRVRTTFGVELTLRAFLKNPTLAGLAEAVEEGILTRAGGERLDSLFDQLETIDETQAQSLHTLDEASPRPAERTRLAQLQGIRQPPPDERLRASLKRLESLSPAKRALFIRTLQREVARQEEARAIHARPRGGAIPASFAQQRLWFVYQFEPDTLAYNVPAVVRLSGPLDTAALAWSLNEIVRRHEVLRTTFATVAGDAVQVIAPELELKIALHDLRSLPAEVREREAQRLTGEEAHRPFDLANGPMLRMCLLRLSGAEHILLLTMHHIVSDGWSIGVLIRELGALYEAFTAGGPSPLAEQPIQYADYAVWQREWLQGEVLETLYEYWRRHLANAPAALEFPTDHPRRAEQGHCGAVQSLVLDASLTKEIRALCRREGVTLFMTLLAAFKALLFRYTEQSDIIVGTPIANRNRVEVEGLIGFFINMLPLRTNVSGRQRFLELLEHVREVSLGAYAHQDLPFEKLVEMLQPKRKPFHAPLFQVTFVLQNVPLAQTLNLPQLTMTPMDEGFIMPQYDLTLTIWEDPETLTARLAYKTDLFEAATVTRILRNYETMLRHIVVQPDVKLGAIERFSENEKRQRVVESKQREDANFKKLLNVKPKPVQLAERRFVRTSYLEEGARLPLVIEPDSEGVNLTSWAKSNLAFIEKELAQHGAILFRQFHVDSVTRFEQFVKTLTPELFEYRERSSPRTEIGKQIYTSTDHPADQWIEMHSEHSYSHQWPMKICFGCLQAARRGGETPVAGNREVLRLLDPAVVETFSEKKVLYVRNYGDGLGVPWQTAFQTSNPADAEAYCRDAGIGFEWKDDGRLRTWQVRDAIAVHPGTGERTWFNHLNIYNVATLEPEVRASLLSLFKEEDLPFNTYYGDGSRIEQSVLQEIREAYRRAMIVFPWQEGDVLVLDNMLTAHGRKPYAGSRRIVVAMGHLVKRQGA
jgi:natural product biosynthesis luciferase-like monooxygenase protein/FkbM family methyltransferase